MTMNRFGLIAVLLLGLSCAHEGPAVDAGVVPDAGSVTDAGVDAGVHPDAGPVGDGGGLTGDGGTTVIGTAGGLSIQSAQAVSLDEGVGIAVYIANIPQLCSTLAVDVYAANATLLVVNLVATGPDGGFAAPQAGTYTVSNLASTPEPSSMSALVWIQQDDSTCNIIGPQVFATAGTITLSGVPSSAFASEPTVGTFDLMFGSDELTGEFNAPSCPTIGPANGCAPAPPIVPLDGGTESEDAGPSGDAGTCGALGQPCCASSTCDANGRLICNASNDCVPDYDWQEWSGSLPEYTPVNYTVNEDGTVTDQITGLLWQQASPSPAQQFTWSSSGAAGSAQAYCAGLNLGGHASGWRLPTYVELWSLMNLDGLTPSINSTAFPNTDYDSSFWVATPYADMPGEAWCVAFDAYVTGCDPTTLNDVRCVYSGDSYTPDAMNTAPAGRYTYPDGTQASSETVFDVVTGLTWQRGTAPGAATQAAAESYCAALDIGHSAGGWRLPTVRELLSIVDVNDAQPAVDPVAFPTATYNLYWASTCIGGQPACDPSSGVGWAVDFYDGSPYAGGALISGTYDVRCVQ